LRVIAGEAKQSSTLAAEKVWIASALVRLAMTRGDAYTTLGIVLGL
jgi:hypothetical protein